MEEEFGSGPWTGFYTYWNNLRQRMDLSLTFKAGIVSGNGSDPVGRFILKGRYDPETNDVRWTKTYPGSHDVSYKGCRDARGIWGTWEIRNDWKGGFHIWPEGEGQGATVHAEADVDLPVEPPVPASPKAPGRNVSFIGS